MTVAVLSSPPRGAGNLALLMVIGGLTAAMLPLADAGRAMGVSPAFYAFAQLAGAGLILRAAAAAGGVAIPADARHLRYYLVSGATGLALPNLVLFALLGPLGPATVALFYVLPPVMTYALAVAVGAARSSRRRWLGVAVAVAGGAGLAGAPGLAPDAAGWLLLGLAAPAALSLGNVYRSRAWPVGTPRLALAAGMVLAGAALLAPAAVLWPSPAPGAADLPALAAIFALQAAVTALCYPLLFLLQARGGPVYVSHLGIAISVAGLVLGGLVAGEGHGTAVWTAAALAIGGAVLANRDDQAEGKP